MSWVASENDAEANEKVIWLTILNEYNRLIYSGTASSNKLRANCAASFALGPCTMP